MAVGSVWAYLFLLGLRAGGSTKDIANTIMVAQFVGAAGALCTATLADRFGRALPILTALLMCLLSQLLLADGMDLYPYIVGVIVFNFFLNMAHPYLYSLLAHIDNTGGIIRFAIAAQMMGIALGPALTASTISQNSLTNVTFVSIAFFVVAIALVFPALSHKSISIKEGGSII